MTMEESKEKYRWLLRLKDDTKELRKMGNDEWQEIAEYIRNTTLPSSDEKLKRCTVERTVMGMRWKLTDNEAADTLDASYVKYINDVLKQIRKGKMDYAFHVYHIAELMRFEPGLKAELVDGLFEVRI